jgi:hypothetical protein
LSLPFFPLLFSFLHQAEIEHQPESNSMTSWILSPWKASPMPCCTEKSWHHFSPSLLAPNGPVRQLAEQTGEYHTPCRTPLLTPTPQEHKPVQPLGRLIPPQKTEKQTANCNQTRTAEGVGGMLNVPWRKGALPKELNSPYWTLSEQTHERQGRLRTRVGEKPHPKAGQVVDHKDDPLNQRAAFKSELPQKT